MTNFKTTKRALVSSVLALVMCFSMLLGTTFAWFTDSVTSSGNIIQTGTLKVEMHWANGTEDPASATWTDASKGAIFSNDKWEPGYTDAKHIKVANEGTLALKYQLSIVPEGEVSKLAEVIDVYLVKDGAQVTSRTALSDDDYYGTLADLINNGISSGSLEAGEDSLVTIVLKMRESAGNEYQDLSIGSFSVQLLATQMTAEEDSFGSDYDADAEYVIEVATVAALKTALANVHDGDVIKLTADMTVTVADATVTNDYADGLVYVGDESFTIDLNGYTLSDNEGDLNDYLIYLKNNGEKANEITIQNGSITVNSQVWSAIAVNSASYPQTSVLNLNNVTVTVGNKENWSNDVIRARHGATINLNDGTVIKSVGTAYGAIAQYSGTLNINSGAKVVHTNSGTSGGNYPYSAISGNGTVNIYEGAVIESDCYGIHNMTTLNPVINIYGGTITAPNALHASTNGAADQSATINVYNGTINGALSTYSDNGHIVVKGGTFTVDPTSYLAKGYEVTESNGTYTVAMKEHTVSSADELAAAIAEGGKVTLTQDVTVTSKLEITADTVIDGNGATLTYTGSNRAIEIPNNADYDVDVTIKDLIVDCSADYCQRGINYNDNGTLTLDNVTVKGNATYGINLPGKSNGATVNINGGSYSAYSALNVWGAGSVITATDVDFITVDNNDNEGAITINLCNDGTTSAEGAVININGGSITVTGSNTNGSYAVKNGTHTGSIKISESTTITGKIWGKTVSVVRYEGTDNYYSHTSLQLSVQCVEENNSGWIVLLEDITVDSLEVNGAVTIDTNGYTLTVGSYTGSGKLTVNGTVVYGN